MQCTVVLQFSAGLYSLRSLKPQEPDGAAPSSALDGSPVKGTAFQCKTGLFILPFFPPLLFSYPKAHVLIHLVEESCEDSMAQPCK